jgi:hypothetical protein
VVDPRVLDGQRWVNSTYGSVPGYQECAEDGITGLATMYSLTMGLQHELGKRPPASALARPIRWRPAAGARPALSSASKQPDCWGRIGAGRWPMSGLSALTCGRRILGRHC